MNAADRAVEVVDPVKGDRERVDAVLAQPHDGELVAGAVRRLGHRHRRATRTSPAAEVKSAKPKELLRLPWVAWADAELIDTDNASPAWVTDCVTAPCDCLSNRTTSLGSKSASSDCWASRLVQAKVSDDVLKKPKASGPSATPTVAPPADIVWNSRLWSAPLTQPPWPSEPIMSGLEANHISECAIVVSARASNTPFGVPSPVVRSYPGPAA